LLFYWQNTRNGSKEIGTIESKAISLENKEDEFMSYSVSMSCWGCRHYGTGKCEDAIKLQTAVDAIHNDWKTHKGYGTIVLMCQGENRNIPELDNPPTDPVPCQAEKQAAACVAEINGTAPESCADCPIEKPVTCPSTPCDGTDPGGTDPTPAAPMGCGQPASE
jgi:hypothetical protein